MGCFATFLLFVVAALWIVASATGRFSRRRKQRQLFAQLARQFGGLHQRGGLFSNPSLRLRYGETWATVSEGGSQRPFSGPSLQVRVYWPHAGIRCEIISRTASERPQKYLRVWQSVEVGGEFGSAFEVLGQDSSEVNQLLTSGVRWQIERLSNLGPDRRLHVLIQGGSIFVEKPWPKLHGVLPAQFVQGALEFYDQCMLAKAVGIQFLHTDEAQPLDHVICKVCGERIQDQMVVCRRCKTPHHQDCWQYTGACSVFGCRETTYVLPPVGHTTAPASHAAGREPDLKPDNRP